ncbi:TPA: hypothetical protein JLQ69_003512 [Escherichia coli]|nr:hypothetical protein [Escherichia coli]
MRDRVTADVNRSHVISEHAGIEWEERYPVLRPGVLYFECERLCAHLTEEGCRTNWEQATSTRPDPEQPSRFAKCRACPIGLRLHTDVNAPINWRDVRSGSECVRCSRRDMRLIAGTTCVSCWNREREGRLNKDARGNVPKTRMVLHPRRVGLVDADGNPTWRRFDAWHAGEAISRAVRQIDSAKFHDKQPGKSIWNERVRRFQYRCDKHPGEFGSLVEFHRDDGTIQYVCPVCKPGRAKGLPEARVCSGTSLSSPEFVRESMTLTGSAAHLTEHFAPTAHICDRCSHYAIEARLRSGKVECRCPMCDQ